MRRVVEGFTPSMSGLQFANDFPEGTKAIPWVPASISFPGGRSLTVNDASAGLCGGMAFTAIDYFEAKRSPDPRTAVPGSDDPLFKHIVRRLLDSWDIPGGALTYLKLMNPRMSDGQTWWRFWTSGRSRVMISREWPKVRADIDSGHPSPLGLIRVKSWNPSDLKFNHQVVTWGYELEGDHVTLLLYDPNSPRDENVTMSLSLARPNDPTPVTYTPDPGRPTWCFFRVRYTPAPPPA
jgi:hypothetical protein